MYLLLRMVKENGINQKNKKIKETTTDDQNRWLRKPITLREGWFFSTCFAKQCRNYEIAKEILKGDSSWDIR